MISGEDRSDRLNRSGYHTLSEQVADDLASDIATGRLPPGARLPSQRELAEIYGVALITIRTAVLELRKRELVKITRGRGTYVAERQGRSRRAEGN